MVTTQRLAKKVADHANAKIQDRHIRHALFLERYATQEVADIVGFLNSDVFPDLLAQLGAKLDSLGRVHFSRSLTPRKATRLKALLQTNADIVSAGMLEAKDRFAKDMIEFGLNETAFTSSVLQSQLPPQVVTFGRATPGTIRAIVNERPASGKRISEWFKEVGGATVRNVNRQINIGVANGESVPQITRRVRGTRANNFKDGVLNTSRNNVEAVVRTSVSHVSTNAREATYKENEDLIEGIKIVATLDNRTTFICMSEDGRVYPVNEGPRPPFHMRCRTTTVPVLKSWEEMGLGNAKLKQLPEGSRASLSGQVPASQKYGDWLKTQPKEFQDLALGKGKAEIFRKGDLTLDKFVGPAGKPLSLAELRKLDERVSNR